MFAYPLPKGLIAQYPCQPRDVARLLVLDRKKENLTHRIFRDLPDYLESGDCLVLNDTKVLPARLVGRGADTGAVVEVFILRPAPLDHGLTGQALYRCLGQPARWLKPGSRLLFDHGSLQAEILSCNQGERLVRFVGENVGEALYRLGEIPLPPYIDRPVESQDAQWYQTIYARRPGAVAAPTAGLHFTPELLEQIQGNGVRVAFVTLHVGWGTFKPVGERELASGRLHPEQFQIPAETLEAIADTKARGGRVIAVGTTVVRTLETWASVPGNPGAGVALEGMTGLFIRPGFKFQVVDALITNFHLPGTSLLLLVSAFAGKEKVQFAYEEAIRQRYRFYSYGDAMLIL